MAEKRKTGRFWILGNKGLDTNLIIITLFLIIFGLIMIYSASYYKCSMSKAFNYDSMHFLKNQDFQVEGAVVVHSVEEALEAVKDYADDKIMSSAEIPFIISFCHTAILLM